jgi:hypothetical protein
LPSGESGTSTEDYITRALAEEINRIAAYYGEKRGGFWVAIEDNKLVGTFGLERASPDAMELRRIMSMLPLDGLALRARCSGLPRMSAVAAVSSDWS